MQAAFISRHALRKAVACSSSCSSSCFLVARSSDMRFMTARTTRSISVKSLPNRLDVKSVWQHLKRNLPAIPRFQEGYWEDMWPKIQIEGARYGLLGSVGLFSVAFMRLTYNASTLIIGFLPYDVHASMGHVTGLASAGALAGGLYKFNQVFYIDPVQVHNIAFALAKRDFWLERNLGGKIRCDSKFSYAATVDFRSVFLSRISLMCMCLLSSLRRSFWWIWISREPEFLSS